MKMRNAIIFLASTILPMVASEDSASATVNENGAVTNMNSVIEESVLQIVNAGLGVNIESVIDPRANRPRESECAISASVSCTDPISGQKCDDLFVPIDECGPTELSFTFKYCNNEKEKYVQLYSDKSGALVEAIKVDLNMHIHVDGDGYTEYETKDEESDEIEKQMKLNYNFPALAPNTCKEFTADRVINTCKRFFSSSLKIHGMTGDSKGSYSDNSDVCYAWDFLRVYIKRPCDITASVSCKVDESRESCADVVANRDDNCSKDEPVTYEFEYCNKEGEPLIVRKQLFLATIGAKDVKEEFDYTDLNQDECRRRDIKGTINTCDPADKKNGDAQLRVEGWKGFPEGDFCTAYDETSIFDNIPHPTDEGCNVSADVKCTIPGTNQSCDDIIVPEEECGEKEMKFKFKYCNNNDEIDVNLNVDKTEASVEGVSVSNSKIDLSPLSPGECRTVKTIRNVNTCKNFFSAMLKLVGENDEEAKDRCYAFGFYRSFVSRDGSPPDDKCKVDVNIKCEHDRTKKQCGDLEIPEEECSTEDPVTFNFEFCNEDKDLPVNLSPLSTLALVETIPADDFDKSPLQPGSCQRVRYKTTVNTCKRFFSARAQLVGRRPGFDDLCQAYDYDRFFVRPKDPKPPTDPPTPAPTTKAPSVICVAPDQATGESTILNAIASISKVDDFEKNSPQSKARDFLTEEFSKGEYNVFCSDLCGNSIEDTIIQRYALAVFYYSTNGDKDWNICGEKSKAECIPRLTNIEDSNSFASNEIWLSNTSECLWGGIACGNANKCVNRIELSKYCAVYECTDILSL